MSTVYESPREAYSMLGEIADELDAEISVGEQMPIAGVVLRDIAAALLPAVHAYEAMNAAGQTAKHPS